MLSVIVATASAVAIDISGIGSTTSSLAVANLRAAFGWGFGAAAAGLGTPNSGFVSSFLGTGSTTMGIVFENGVLVDAGGGDNGRASDGAGVKVY